MSTEPEKYCFDTNCFIEPWNKFYSYKSHKSYWDDFLLSEIKKGNIIILREVYDEIMKKADELSGWFKGHKIKANGMVVDTDSALAQQVQNLTDKYDKLVSAGRGRSVADPFIIEYARIHNLSVVTLEIRSGNLNNPKIPDVCGKEGVSCINLYEYIDKTGVSFGVVRHKEAPPNTG